MDVRAALVAHPQPAGQVQPTQGQLTTQRCTPNPPPCSAPRRGKAGAMWRASPRLVQLVRAVQPGQQRFTKLCPHSCLLPISQPASAGHARTASHLLGQDLPGNPALQYEPYAGQCPGVGDALASRIAEPSGIGAGSSGCKISHSSSLANGFATEHDLPLQRNTAPAHRNGMNLLKDQPPDYVSASHFVRSSKNTADRQPPKPGKTLLAAPRITGSRSGRRTRAMPFARIVLRMTVAKGNRSIT